MVCCRKYSVPHFAFWPTFIMGSAGPGFGHSYEALCPFSGVFPPFYVPNVIRLPVWRGDRGVDLMLVVGDSPVFWPGEKRQSAHYEPHIGFTRVLAWGEALTMSVKADASAFWPAKKRQSAHYEP
jgi:hypothetical protein